MLPELAYIHGGCLIFVDGIGMFSGLPNSSVLAEAKQKTLEFLFDQVPECAVDQQSPLGLVTGTNNREEIESVMIDETKFGMSPFFIPRGLSYAG